MFPSGPRDPFPSLFWPCAPLHRLAPRSASWSLVRFCFCCVLGVLRAKLGYANCYCGNQRECGPGVFVYAGICCSLGCLMLVSFAQAFRSVDLHCRVQFLVRLQRIPGRWDANAMLSSKFQVRWWDAELQKDLVMDPQDLRSLQHCIEKMFCGRILIWVLPIFYTCFRNCQLNMCIFILSPFILGIIWRVNSLLVPEKKRESP